MLNEGSGGNRMVNGKEEEVSKAGSIDPLLGDQHVGVNEGTVVAKQCVPHPHREATCDMLL